MIILVGDVESSDVAHCDTEGRVKGLGGHLGSYHSGQKIGLPKHTLGGYPVARIRRKLQYTIVSRIGDKAEFVAMGRRMTMLPRGSVVSELF